MPRYFEWTPERQEQARTLWRSGSSATEIAKKLGGGVSRCAVIGKLRRLGEEKRNPEAGKIAARINVPKPTPRACPPGPVLAAPLKTRPEVQAAVAPVQIEAPAPVKAVRIRTAPLNCEPVSMEALTADSCRWPIGGYSAPASAFCGAPKERGPYCAAHGAIAYTSLPNGQKPDAKAYMRAMRRYA
jgi:GcrA cell cycle regulator